MKKGNPMDDKFTCSSCGKLKPLKQMSDKVDYANRAICKHCNSSIGGIWFGTRF